MTKRISQSVEYIKSICSAKPSVGIILGTGLSTFIKEIKIESEISYGEIPHFPVSTVEGHHGKLIFGELSGKDVVVMAGRFHFYEGYSADEVVFPVRVMKYLGVQTLLISNAAGGVNTGFEVGDLMIIKDHISQFTVNPLVGKNEKEFGTRFPDMSEPYDKILIQISKHIGEAKGIVFKE
jgi:purine-nucleoside phosphorylase